MHELVNTSLPNGLIAGTHGFATVAMTRGIPDLLRGRLEALCAYTHRTSVHDETYYLQNPVNWFHVTLPQGEHVVGRVAPSEFDYTGRTNRLARLRVFGAGEMPGAGAAAVLCTGKAWFSEPWQGDPRYLDDNRDAAIQLRGLTPARTASAPAWAALFGNAGQRYAQQIAWQVEKAVVSGGKSVYFKTSAAWDVSGERLLGLFADVINLMPVELRQRVTFSTYPVSLPGGTGCNLRGVYDGDKVFEASSGVQPWVDCENARVVHAELLPTSGNAAAGERAGSEAGAAAISGGAVKSPRLEVPGKRGSDSYRKLLAPERKGPDMFVAGVIAAGVVILLAAGGVFYWMTRTNEREMVESGAAEAVEMEIRNLEQEKEEKAKDAEAERLAAEKRLAEDEARKAEEKRKDEERRKAEAEADAATRKLEKEKADMEAKAAADLAAARLKKEAEERAHQCVAYLDATEFRRGYPSYAYDSLTQKCKEPFMAEDGCLVYYYDGDTVTNAPAGFKVLSGKSSGILRWGDGLGRKLDDVPLARNGFVLWYNPAAKRVYIDLNRRMAGDEDGERWFADSTSVDLAQKYFGPDPNFVRLWEKYRGAKTRYLISWKYGEKCCSVRPNVTDQSRFTTDQMLELLLKNSVRDFDDSIASARRREPKLQKELDVIRGELKDIQGETNAMWRVWRAYQAESARIASLNAEDDRLKTSPGDLKPHQVKEKRKQIELDVRACKKTRLDILAEGTEKPTGGQIKGVKKYSNIGDLESKIRSRESAVEAKEREVSAKRAQIDLARKSVSAAEEAKRELLGKFKDNIRKVQFTVRVEGETIKE